MKLSEYWALQRTFEYCGYAKLCAASTEINTKQHIVSCAMFYISFNTTTTILTEFLHFYLLFI